MISFMDLMIYGSIIFFTLGFLIPLISNKFFSSDYSKVESSIVGLYFITTWIGILILLEGSTLSGYIAPSCTPVFIENISFTTSGTTFEESLLIQSNISSIKADLHTIYSTMDRGLSLIGIGLTIFIFSVTMILNTFNLHSINSGFYLKNKPLYDKYYSDFYTSLESFTLRLQLIKREIKKRW